MGIIVDVQANRIRVDNLLQLVNREGMAKMLIYLEKSDYFTAPASARFHGCYEGGLVAHSLGVHDRLMKMNDQFKFGVSQETIIVATLFHDLCKLYKYKRSSTTQSGWTVVRGGPTGHAALSLKYINDVGLELRDLEFAMIQFHMGVYGLEEFDNKGEYTLRGGGMMQAWFRNPIVKAIYFCDELDTFEAKATEGIN